jgi:nucleoside-triphosphatase THEP1
LNLIVTGKVQSGKTSWCTGYCRWLVEQKFTVGGILCPEARHLCQKVGYNIIDIQTGRSVPFARFVSESDLPGELVGDYLISHEGLEFAKMAIEMALDNRCNVVFIDEIGHLELLGKGIIDSAKMAYAIALNTVSVIRKPLLIEFFKGFSQQDAQKEIIIKDIELDTNYPCPKKP